MPSPKTLFDFVKFEHTLFSLPVILAGAMLAARGWPDAKTLAAILVAGTGARTAALALNRIFDRAIDARNPRTKGRELPAGKMTLESAWAVAAAGLVLYAAALAFLPPLCAKLSPIPIAVFVLYPLMKRFTPLAHFGVGLGLGMAPIAAWVAVTGSFSGSMPAVWLGIFTWLWVAGFDVIYATLDEEFDRREGLHSIPARWGRENALRTAAFVHTAAFAALAAMTVRFAASPAAYVCLAAVAVLLLVEHRMAHRVELAFFHVNAVLGFVVWGIVLAGV
jgi:4-hydroxybenzoate polyprenyltransferase